LANAIELTLTGSQKDFPVGYHNRLTKVLHHSDLIKGLQEQGESARISELALQDILTADINEPLRKLLERMQGNPAQMICVMDNDHVVGLLNLENILELIKIHDAIGKHSVTGSH
jgi:CBS domain containing-hemolysin-like protein